MLAYLMLALILASNIAEASPLTPEQMAKLQRELSSADRRQPASSHSDSGRDTPSNLRTETPRAPPPTGTETYTSTYDSYPRDPPPTQATSETPSLSKHSPAYQMRETLGLPHPPTSKVPPWNKYTDAGAKLGVDPPFILDSPPHVSTSAPKTPPVRPTLPNKAELGVTAEQRSGLTFGTPTSSMRDQEGLPSSGALSTPVAPPAASSDNKGKQVASRPPPRTASTKNRGDSPSPLDLNRAGSGKSVDKPPPPTQLTSNPPAPPTSSTSQRAPEVQTKGPSPHSMLPQGQLAGGQSSGGGQTSSGGQTGATTGPGAQKSSALGGLCNCLNKICNCFKSNSAS